jgi:protein gp37
MKPSTNSPCDRLWRPTRAVELTDPLRWRKAGRVRVVEDIFADCADDSIDRVFAVMALAPHLTFQVLTKRAKRMREYFAARRARVLQDQPATETTQWHIWSRCTDLARRVEAPWCWSGTGPGEEILGPWPLPNVWLGVSVEDQKAADERIPELLATPAAVRFLSVEPLLGPVRILGHLMDGPGPGYCRRCKVGHGFTRCPNYGGINSTLAPGEWGPSHPGCDRFVRENFSIHWVIVGGESGPGARPCDVAWIRSVVKQCRAVAVPCFVKQLGAMAGEWDRVPCEPPYPTELGYRTAQSPGDGYCLVWPPKGPPFWHKSKLLRMRDRKGGDPSEWPEDLRFREFPEARRG